MRRALAFGFLVVVLASAALADGPEVGIVTGKVVNADGEGLPGVQVTLEGGRGEQVTVTSEGGNYRFSLVPPGAYKVKAALEGFTEGHLGVQVSAGGKAEADITLRLETAESITVTSEAPMVDKFNVSAGETVTSEVGAQAAGENRTYYGVINMLPGVTSDAENGAIQGTRPQVNGSHFADNSVFIDGVDTSFARFGGSRVFVPTTATTEIALEAGGMSAEYGRVVGSTTNVIIKSGTNVFHGDFLYGRADSDWNADWKDQVKISNKEFPTSYQSSAVSPIFGIPIDVVTPRPPYPKDFLKRLPEEEGHSDSYEAALGGPIVKDKAWFFIAVSENDTFNPDKTLDQEVVDASFNFKARIGKLSFQPTDRHQLSASYIDAPSKRIYFHTPSHDRWNPTPHDLAGDLATLSWNFSISQNFFLETKLATQTSDENKYLAEPTGDENTDVDRAIAAKQQDPRFPGDPSQGPHWPGNNFASYWDSRDDSTWHNGWILDNGFGLNEYPRDQANLAATWFPSESHELKFGADWQEVKWKSHVRVVDLYVGPDYTSFDPAGFENCNILLARYCVWFDRRPVDVLDDGNTDPRTGFTQSDTSTEVGSFYARDRFTVGDHWIFNLGGRVSQMSGYNDVRRKVMDDLNYEPRIAATYDLHGNGKMLASVNVGRYHAQLNQQFISQWMQELWTGSLGFDSFLWCGNLDALVGLCGPGVTGYHFPLSSQRTGIAWDWIDAGLWDHDLEAYYKDEVVAGFEWQFAKNWAFDAKGIVYELGDMIGNTIQRDPLGRYMDVTANYKDYKKILRAINAEAVRLGRPAPVPESALAWFREGRKEYEALQVQVNRRFAKSWALYTNITWADTSSTGSGAWWNNTDSTYAYDLGTVVTEDTILQCELRQQGIVSGSLTGQVQISNGRTVPIPDCRERLTPWLGAPASIVNRFGKDGVQSERYDEGGALADRPIIAKTFGFKQWTVGKQTFNLGGFFTWQSGIAWGRVEAASPLADAEGNSGAVQFGNGLDIQVEPVGERRTAGWGTLNLSGAWGFPIKNRVTGELRIEMTNVTDHQLQVNINDQGEVQPVRRDFNQPRQARANVSFRF